MHIKSKLHACICITITGITVSLAGISLLSAQSINLDDLMETGAILGIRGNEADTRLGALVSQGGDFNNDGIDDVIIGTYQNGVDTLSRDCFVIFGSTGLTGVFDLSTLNQPDNLSGTLFQGISEFDRFCVSISAAGDINNDSVSDIMIGANSADSNSQSSTGQSYIIFGTDSLPAAFNISNLNSPGQLSGITINGATEFDFSGVSLSIAGDINDDGRQDILIGANSADPNGQFAAGIAYSLFGQNSFQNTIDLSELNAPAGTPGTQLKGEAGFDNFGRNVSRLGDFNGDDIDDFILYAGQTDSSDDRFGAIYIVFGQSNFPEDVESSELNLPGNPQAVSITIRNPDDSSFIVVDSAGDINNDGFDDALVGLRSARSNQTSFGKAYILFGQSGLTGSFNLSDINSAGSPSGLILTNNEPGLQLGTAVGGSADINNDGIEDAIIGAASSTASSAFIIFGNDNLPVSELEVTELNNSEEFTGLRISNSEIFAQLGTSTDNAGDFNGDSIDDMIIGAPGTSFNGSGSAGAAYVFFGRNHTDIKISKTNNANHADSQSLINYIITVENAGFTQQDNITVQDMLPATLINAAWTCAPSGSASCTANGTGDISDTISLPFNTSVVYQLQAEINTTEGDVIVNQASIILEAGQMDMDLTNNFATDIDIVGLFADGMERTQ